MSVMPVSPHQVQRISHWIGLVLATPFVVAGGVGVMWWLHGDFSADRHHHGCVAGAGDAVCRGHRGLCHLANDRLAGVMLTRRSNSI